METVLPNALPREVSSENVLGLVWSLIVKATRRDVLSREESMLMEQTRAGAKTYGIPILEATDLQNLKDRIAEVAEDPSFHDYWQGVMSTAMSMGHELWKSSTRQQSSESSREILQSVLSGGALPKVEQGLKYLEASVRLLPSVMKQLSAMGDDQGSVLSVPPLDLIYDQNCPTELAEALYENQCCLVVTFALNAAIARGQKLEPWLSIGLAERWSRGLKSSLCLLLLAADNEIAAEVPESVLPREERLDVNAMIARHARVEDAFRALNTAAERAGASVYPARL